MSEPKELHFFDRDKLFRSDEVDYSIYHAPFEEVKHEKIIGESTPIYMYWKPVCRRIRAYNAQIKVICLLRNPIDRAYSQWNMQNQTGDELESFDDSIESEEKRLKESWRRQSRRASYVDRGKYAGQIRRYKRFFPDEQLHFIKYEDFRDAPEMILNATFDFLEVDGLNYLFSPIYPQRGLYRSQMGANTRSYLQQVFSDDIKAVERLLGWDCSDWR